MSATVNVQNQQIYSILRPRKNRTKTGCLACRGRRKKCDEQRPVCGLCSRLHLICSWPDAPPAKQTLVEESQKLNVNHVKASQAHLSEAHRDEGTSSFALLQEAADPTTAPSDETSLVELTDLRQHLWESGIYPYHIKVSPELRDRILTTNGAETAMLFDHFCHRTAPLLINGNLFENPVLKHVVPMTAHDDLVLNTILAISGSHFENSTPLIEALTMKHYLAALQMLSGRLSDWLRKIERDYRPLLATTILLCHCEFIQGNTYGAALRHLRACHEFIKVALQHLADPGHQDFVVFMVEHYGYFVLMANLRSMPREDDIHLGLEFCTNIMPQLKGYSSFGTIFAFEPDVFYLIPHIAQLSWEKKQEHSVWDNHKHNAVYATLLKDLTSSQGSAVQFRGGKPSDLKLWGEMETVFALKVNALLIFLQSSFEEHTKTQDQFGETIRDIIESSMMLVPRIDENEFCYGMFWSLLVIGSFIQDAEHRAVLIHRLKSSRLGMPFVKNGIDLLSQLWKEDDEWAFGLNGLEKVAMAQGVDLCMG